MKESEAREKWCPMVRHMTWLSTTEPSGGNKPEDASTCIASDCMMWRYHDTSPNGQKKGDGHCGLAGKP